MIDPPPFAAQRSRIALVAAALVLAGLAMRNEYQVIANLGAHLPINDLRLYYAAALIGEHQGWTRIYDGSLQAAAVRDLWPHSAWLPYVTPPQLAWLAIPLTLLPYPAAYVAGLVVGTALMLVAALVAPARGAIERLLVAGSLFALDPAYVTQFQVNVAAAFPLLLVGGWRLLETRREVAAGFVLSAGLLKPQLVGLVPLALLFGGHRRAFAAWLVGAAVIALTALPVLLPQYHDYVRLLAIVGARVNQQRWTAFYMLGSGWLGWLANAATVAAVVFVSHRSRGRGAALPIAAAILGSLLVSHYLNFGDYMLLAIPIWLLASLAVRAFWFLSAGLWVSAAVAYDHAAVAMAAAALALGFLAVASTRHDLKLFAEWHRKRNSTPS